MGAAAAMSAERSYEIVYSIAPSADGKQQGSAPRFWRVFAASQHSACEQFMRDAAGRFTPDVASRITIRDVYRAP